MWLNSNTVSESCYNLMSLKCLGHQLDEIVIRGIRGRKYFPHLGCQNVEGGKKEKNAVLFPELQAGKRFLFTSDKYLCSNPAGAFGLAGIFFFPPGNLIVVQAMKMNSAALQLGVVFLFSP